MPAWRRPIRPVTLSAVLTSLPSCAAAPPPDAAADPARPGHTDTAPQPLRGGTLRQDDFSIHLHSGTLLIRVTPLHERVLRLAAPDTQARLRPLAAQGGSEAPSIFLVTFFSDAPDTPYDPEAVRILYQGRLLHPSRIVPLNSEWASARLRTSEALSALYLFDEPIDPFLPHEFRYGGDRVDWGRVLPKLLAEEARQRVHSP